MEMLSNTPYSIMRVGTIQGISAMNMRVVIMSHLAHLAVQNDTFLSAPPVDSQTLSLIVEALYYENRPVSLLLSNFVGERPLKE